MRTMGIHESLTDQWGLMRHRDYWRLMRPMETDENHGDNWRLMRPMGNHETQRDYWRLMENNGNA